MLKWWKNFRYRNAFKFGRLEHNTSRLLFVCLLITYGLHLFKYYQYVGYALVVDIILWLIYWGSHRMEKLFHPNH